MSQDEYRPQPVYFGSDARPLFGWLYRAHSGSDVGLVICNPFGFDAICSHRAMRHLAAAACRLGMPAIRFDYDGTSDSAGDEFEGAQVDRWLASIHAACDHLKTATKVTRICLLGIRFGALLAAAAARTRTDIVGAIHVVPVVRAKSYLRELRAFQVASVTTDDPADGNLESGGYVMTPETVAAVEALEYVAPSADNATSRSGSPERMVIFDREDLPSARQAADRLRMLGVDVNYVLTREHELLVRSPTILQLPEQIIGVTTEWLAKLRSECVSKRVEQVQKGITRTPDGASATFTVSSADTVCETAEFLDADRRLFAITTTGSVRDPQRSNKRYGILMINSGAVHHIGPSRLYVTLARKWALAGHAVMRMDVTGIGDSPAPPTSPENIVYSSHACDDVLTAIDALTKRHDVDAVIAMGLCSGAYHSFVAAKAGAAVDKIVLLNPLTFYWQDGMPLDEGELSPRAAVAAVEAQRYKRSIWKLQTWRKLLTGKADIASFVKVAASQLGTKLTGVQRDMRRLLGTPMANDLPSDFKKIIARGIQPTMVFSSTDLGLPRMLTLGGTSLRRLIRSQRARLNIVEGADHTFMQLKHRRELMAMLTDILKR